MNYSDDKIQNMSDESILIDIIKSDADFNTRALACSNPNLKDEIFLEDIALNDIYESVRIQAVKNVNLTNEDVLVNVAVNDSHYLVRFEAIKKISAEETLVYIFFNDSVKSLRCLARDRLKEIKPDSIYLTDENNILNINDENTLKEIAGKSMYSSSRICALHQIHDESFLYNFILHENDYRIATEAVKNIDDADLLTDIALNEIYCQTRIEAIKNPNFNDESLLADLALNDDNFEIRRAAILNPNFCDKKLLNKIIKEDNDYNVRIAARDKLI